VVGNHIRFGFFTLTDLEMGTEVTFDYKFELYGQKAQVCHCGESHCKGFIGGDGKNRDFDDVLSDSSDELPESTDDDDACKLHFFLGKHF
jgi:hypothetical protein